MPKASLARCCVVLAALVGAPRFAPAETPITVRIGTPNVASDAPLYIAAEKGYFAREGLTLEFVPFTGPKDLKGLIIAEGGRLAGPRADEVIAILVKYTNLKDPELYRKIAPSELDPDGGLNVESLSDALRFYQARGIVTSDVAIGALVDDSFAKAALEKLGRYQPAHDR